MIFSEKFIKATEEYCDYSRYVPAPYMRRSFVLEKAPEKAEITLTALGFYRLYINGTDITKGILAPYISNSDQTVYFDNYDITKYLTAGKNTVAFILGNGHQNCFGGHVWHHDMVRYRSAPKLSFAIEADELVIEADEKVVTHPSGMLLDDIRLGVHYDARCEIDGWNLPEFSDSDWKPAIVTEPARGEYVLCIADPVVVYRELSPVSVTENVKFAKYAPRKNYTEDIGSSVYDSTEDDSKFGYLYDFGENNAGIFRLKIKGEKGQRIVIQACEILDENGCPSAQNIDFYYPGFAQRDIYICRGDGEEVFVPDFTYHGYRYLWVTGITKEQATKELLTYLVAGSQLETMSDFSCSDDITNKLWQAGMRSDRSNFYYFPTDCPHREKNGWTGDAAISAEHMTLKFDLDKTYRAWLHSIRNAQGRDGAIPAVIPTGVYGFAWGNGPVWDSVIFALPYYTYIYRGKTEMIKENAHMMMRYLSYITTRRDSRGLIEIGLGDWCPAYGDHPGDYDVPLIFTDSVATMESARMASVMFEAVGLTLQAEFAKNIYREMREAIRRHLIDFSTMTVHGACQSGQAIAIALGVFDECEKSEAFTRLLEFIAECDNHFNVGFYGARYLFHVLSDFGEEELAFEMITRTDFPAYGYWIANGSTTLRESFPKPGSRVGQSHNHHFWGNITAWFTKTIVGININPDNTDPAFVRIKPHFISKLEHAEGYYDTVCGRVSVSWKRDGCDILLDITAPEGISGEIILPFGYRYNRKSYLKLTSGTIRLTKSQL